MVLTVRTPMQADTTPIHLTENDLRDCRERSSTGSEFVSAVIRRGVRDPRRRSELLGTLRSPRAAVDVVSGDGGVSHPVEAMAADALLDRLLTGLHDPAPVEIGVAESQQGGGGPCPRR